MVAIISFYGSFAHVFADANPNLKQDYVGKHITYSLESSITIKNKLVQSVSGQIKYEIVSFDSKSGEFDLTKTVDLKYKDGKKFTTKQDLHSRLNNPLSLFDIVSYIDPLFPGKTEFAIAKKADSKGKESPPSGYEISIVKRDLLEKQTVLNHSIEPTLVYTLKGSAKVFDQTMIPSAITLDLKSVSLEGVNDKAIYKEVLADYGQVHDYYKNMKFSLKIISTDTDFKNSKNKNSAK